MIDELGATAASAAVNRDERVQSSEICVIGWEYSCGFREIQMPSGVFNDRPPCGNIFKSKDAEAVKKRAAHAEAIFGRLRIDAGESLWSGRRHVSTTQKKRLEALAPSRFQRCHLSLTRYFQLTLFPPLVTISGFVCSIFFAFFKDFVAFFVAMALSWVTCRPTGR